MCLDLIGGYNSSPSPPRVIILGRKFRFNIWCCVIKKFEYPLNYCSFIYSEKSVDLIQVGISINRVSVKCDLLGKLH